MDRSPVPQGLPAAPAPPPGPVQSQPSAPTAGGSGSPPSAGGHAADATPVDRVVPVYAGQRFQATVVAQDGDRVWFGYRGSVFEARSAVQLAVGRSFDFLVAATSPQIELVQAKGVAAVSAPTPMSPAATLPLGGQALATALATFAAALSGDRSPGSDQGSAGLPPELRAALQQWTAGAPTAAALAAIDRHLGHEHEARLLRLATAAASAAPAAVAAARTSAKAKALSALEAAVEGRPVRTAAAAALVEALGGIERDNAARAELGAPLWLPLPACPEAGLRDARMFLVPPAGDGDGAPAQPGERPFTIVLLLDLTQLGELRVDVALRGNRIDATFVALRPATTERLSRTFAGLREQLAAAGLEVDRLQVRTAPPQGLPSADLTLPPRDGSALVDLHA